QDDLEDVYISEKLENKTGWNKVFVSESIKRGYVKQMQDFLECVVYGRQPISNFEIAAETTKVLYAAYISDSEGRRVCF
ncbi:MAG: gfo/Idh/MocA family oxidoreductase, partial [Tissierellia bacterium]|nr:gfo/Idh/MocA family oxidoreductase [Tissierellia bacterium]